MEAVDKTVVVVAVRLSHSHTQDMTALLTVSCAYGM